MPHDERAVALGPRRMFRGGRGDGHDLRASAITDRRDVVPAGIEVGLGGAVQWFGIAGRSGNLLLLADVAGKPVIGLPGCARSPKINGFDFVLQRLLADVAVTPRDIVRMGAGGLLKEIPTLASAARGRARSPRQPRIAALVLAAGRSTRMGTNKLLAEIDGKPMVRQRWRQHLPARPMRSLS